MLSSTLLRIIAAVTMLIDHSAHILVDPSSAWYIPLRSIGRLAFPIFCFLIVEGLEHTSSLRKYLSRLAIFAFISEIPFDLAFGSGFFDPSSQNVYITLFCGLASIAFAKYTSVSIMQACGANENVYGNRFNQLLVASPVIAAACVFCDALNTDYGSYGVMIICALYLARNCRPAAITLLCALTVHHCITISFDDVSRYNVLQFSGYLLKPKYQPQILACLAGVPIALYNGKPGKKLPKYAFYIFYPAHLLVLVAVRLIIMG